MQSLLAGENVLREMHEWRRDGLRTSLVTLVGIDGKTPRQLGAQMAVAEDGRFVGYLSGGCLEAAVAEEAKNLIEKRQNELVRFGKGSRYFDIRLPCGSGLDLYFDQQLEDSVVDLALETQKARRPFFLETDLATGKSAVRPAAESSNGESVKEGDLFRRAVLPALRVFSFGAGPMLVALTNVMHVIGAEQIIASPDTAARDEIASLGQNVQPLSSTTSFSETKPDRWSAAIVAFHEHEREVQVLADLMKTECFYIGVLGSKRAHMERLDRLAKLGFAEKEMARLQSPVGLISGAKSRVTLVVGIAAELLARAKAIGLVA